MPERLQMHRTRGFRLPLNGMSVVRPSKWGNPFVVRPPLRKGEPWRVTINGQVLGSFDEEEQAIGMAVDLYLPWVAWRVSGDPKVRADFEKLRGHDLGCFCPLPEPGGADVCHAAVLLRLLAESAPGSPA